MPEEAADATLPPPKADPAPPSKTGSAMAPSGTVPKKPRGRGSAKPGSPPASAAEGKPPKKASRPKAPRRPSLDPELGRLLAVRDQVDLRRPKFVRTASHRYWRVGRRASWRRPRGLQSKQRRHYGYRPVVVSIGYGSPARTRGLTPTGFRPVLVHTPRELERLDPSTEAAVLARTVGTRKRLVLEELARKTGVHVLNPISSDRKEE